jgi:hypothetical protein
MFISVNNFCVDSARTAEFETARRERASFSRALPGFRAFGREVAL